MKQQFDSTKLGLAVGFLLPVFIVAITFFVKGYSYGITPYLKGLVQYGVLTKMLSLCVYPNLIPFFLGIWTNRLQTARGVLGATIAMAVITFVLQLIF